ncbi:hypothetical protein EV127DRAFT_163834 [Xylaria flabelliformis]|nr:hypothetical protein EV127DRAFT_163834 [Xylaria flabelliformis]
MGILYIRRDERASHPIVKSNAGPNQSISGDTTVDPWLIVVIVAGSLILVTLAGVLVAHYIRSRRRGGKGSFHPVEKVRSVSFSRKRNSDAAADRQKIEDLERDMMIRKSLASRPASASFPSASQPLNNGDDHPEPEEEEEREREEMTSLREDWKAWEARVQTERGTAAYPGGVGLDRHPAFAPYLPVPQPTRMISPHRSVGAHSS